MKYLVYGMGISGKGVADLLNKMGREVVLFDRNEKIDMEGIVKELGLPENTETVKGEFPKERLGEFDAIAISPGVSINAPDIVLAKEAGIPVLGEIELAYEAAKGRLAAITGTNGKTTTTSLAGEIMRAAYPETFVVGNIGYSYAKAAPDTTENSVTVAEISSFQLESIRDFHPEVSAILNLTPDHLDRHGSFENYAKTKCLITMNQTKEDKCIVNYDDNYLRELSSSFSPTLIYFSLKEKLSEGIFMDDGVIYYADGQNTERVIGRSEISLMGDHNVENVMAAIGIGVAMGVSLETIAEVIRNFKAVEHRIEYVCTKGGVKYYNDSKGTNTDAAAKAVESMTSPTVLIAGGYDKGLEFDDWIKGFNGRVKAMVLIGQTAEKIKETALKCGFTDIYMEENLEAAVKTCASLAKPGDAVLLSPACASWGQFDNYEQRGRMFKDFVRALED